MSKKIETTTYNDSEMIHEVLSVLNQRNLSVNAVQRILDKARRSAGLTTFSWNKSKEIPGYIRNFNENGMMDV